MNTPIAHTLRGVCALAMMALSSLSCLTTPAAEVLRLDFENSGNLALDTSGNGLVGTIIDNSGGFAILNQSSNTRPGSPGTGSANFQVDDFEVDPFLAGAYIDFDDVDFPDFTGAEDFSVSFWINPSADWVADSNGFRGAVSGSSLLDLGWQVDNGDTVPDDELGNPGDGTTTPTAFNRFNVFTDLIPEVNLTADAWTKLEFSYLSGSQVTLIYVDNALSGAAQGSLTMDGFHVGSNRNGVRMYDGLLDDLVVLDTSGFVDSNGIQREIGDLTLDGIIDASDWLALRGGQATDLSALSILDAYQQGDVDLDGDNDFRDFQLFKQIFNSSSAAVGTAPWLASVPEPSSFLLILGFVALTAMVRIRAPRFSECTYALGSPSSNYHPEAIAIPMKRMIVTFIAVVGIVATAATVNAQRIINIDITTTAQDTGPVAFNLPGVIGKASDVNWNGVSNADPLTDLVDEDGLASPVGFQLTGTFGAETTTGIGDVAAPGVFSISGGGGNEDFFRNYAFAHGGGNPGSPDFSTFTISGLGSGTTVNNVVLYATWDFIEAGTEFRLSTDGGATFTDWLLSNNATSESNAPFVEGSSYVQFSNLTAHTDGTILGEWRTTLEGGSVRHRGPFNGLQISADVQSLALELQVAANGEMTLVNPTDQPVVLDYFEILSADVEQDGGSLNPTGFTGLGGDPAFVAGNNDGTGWELADNNNDLTLIESFLPPGGSTIGAGTTVAMGSGFVPGSTEDISFQYHIVGADDLVQGLVEFGTVANLPGDFDGNGEVNGADFLTWQRNPAVGNLADWENNYGATSGGAAVAAAAVPEPAALASCVVGLLLCCGVRTRR